MSPLFLVVAVFIVLAAIVAVIAVFVERDVAADFDRLSEIEADYIAKYSRSFAAHPANTAADTASVSAAEVSTGTTTVRPSGGTGRIISGREEAERCDLDGWLSDEGLAR